MEIIDVRDYGGMLTIKHSITIAFEITVSEDNRAKVVINWDEWGLARMPPKAKVREAALKAAEHLASGADERLASVASALKEYGEQYTTEIGRRERGKQLG